MPIFEFHCTQCNKDFEDLVLTPSDRSTIVCPHCKSGQLHRKLSAFTSAVKQSAAACADGQCALNTNNCANGSCGLS